MQIDLTGRTAFLTGASRGIGKRIKEVLEAAGSTVLAPGRGELDLACPEQVAHYIEMHPHEIDLFIHCAAINPLAGMEEIQLPLLLETFQVNLFSAVQLLRGYIGGMKRNGWGRVLFISSLYALISKERRIAYSASKSALTGLTRSLALEFGRENILVNAVAPGYVMTDMTEKNLSKAEIEAITAQIPQGRMQSEDDIANLVAFLCSDLNQSITGQLIAVDGGLTCR